MVFTGTTGVMAGQDSNETIINGSRVDASEIPEGNYIYFGAVSASFPEADSLYLIPVYREGDLSEGASVEINTIDMSALYGKDYEIEAEDVKKCGDGKTLLQKEYLQEGADEAENDLTEALGAGDGIIGSERVNASSVSRLAQLKEAQTGESTRDIVLSQAEQEEVAAAGNECMKQIYEGILGEMDHSSEFTVEFAPGESEKYVRLKIKDDSKSEDEEGFSLVMTQCEGAEVYNAGTFSGVIEDNEPLEYSEVSFSKKRYTSDNGKVTITVKRKGAEYSLVDMSVVTQDDTAKADINYNKLDETLAFAPYETEKEFTINVAGSGKFKIVLTDYKGCEEGKITEAEVILSEETEESEVAENTEDEGEEKSFKIKVNNTDYVVRYKDGDVMGRIMDESYDPAVEAGKYIFSADTVHGGWFKYGNWDGAKPWGCGVRKSEYHVADGNDFARNYGDLKYYHTTMWKTGRVWTYSDSKLPLIFFQYLSPDWTSTSSFGIDGQKADFQMSTAKWTDTKRVEGRFDRTLENSKMKFGKNAGNSNANTSDTTAALSVFSLDTNNLTPKSFVEFYGIAAMYKMYELSLVRWQDMEFLRPGGNIYSAAVQVVLKCGEDKINQPLLRTKHLYYNPQSQSESENTVFSTDIASLGSHAGIFAYIIGYNITINPTAKNEDKTELKYPEGFFAFLDMKSKSGSNGYVDYSSSAIQTEKDKVNRSMATVPFDKYFAAWIEYEQKKVRNDGDGYNQVLQFQPILEYYTSKVKVLPAKDNAGYFVDKNLAVREDGSCVNYHIGDEIDLTAEPYDKDKYEFKGYEYTTKEGEEFTTVSGKTSLFLEEKAATYYIRPVFSEKKNRIELNLTKEAQGKVEIENLMSEAELKEYEPSWKNKLVLKANPEMEKLSDKITPVISRDYTINVKVTAEPENPDYVYRPVIIDNMTGTKYNGQTFYTTGRVNISDNVYTVDVEKVRKGDLKTYTVKGNLLSEIPPVRDDAEKIKTLPISGYNVITGTAQNKDKVIGSTGFLTGNDGKYIISGVTAKKGDRIKLLISNGVTYSQVAEATLNETADREGDEIVANAGNTVLNYPNSMPRIASLTYKYDKPQHNLMSDLTQNTVRIFDDTLELTANVDLKGKTIKEVIFRVVSVSGIEVLKVKGVKKEQTSTVFVASIENMLERLHNGDTIRLQLVDEEQKEVKIGNRTAKVDIVYPEVDSGLKFYVENSKIVPQNYALKGKTTVKVPMLGAALADADTGALSFKKTNWEKGTGYTIDINIGATVSSFSSLTTEGKKAYYQKYIDLATKAKAEYKSAEEINGNITLGKNDIGEDLKTAEGQMKANEEMLHKQTAAMNAKNMMAGLNSAPYLSVSGNVIMAFQFIYNPVKKKYVFLQGAVTIGGTFKFNKLWHTMLGQFPIFVSTSGIMQTDYTHSWVGEKVKEAFDADDFSSYAGNLADIMERVDSEGSLNVMFSLTLEAGSILAKYFAPKGFVSVQMKFVIPTTFTSDNGGAMLGSNGGIAIDLVFTNFQFPFVNLMKGWGSLAGKTKVEFLGGIANLIEPLKLSGEEHTSIDYEDFMNNYELYYAGTGDMDSFGSQYKGSLMSTPKAVNMEVLLENAAELTRPKIISLGGDRKMIIFIGSRNDDNNPYALYYSIFDGNKWSRPETVDDDGTMDAVASVQKIGNKVVIAWSDSGKAFNEKQSLDEILSSLDVSVAVYDIDTGIMGEKHILVEDDFMNLVPELSVSGNKVYCSYLKVDIKGTKNALDLLNLEKKYSTMAYVQYDLETGESENEHFITVKHPSLKDPMVVDYQSQTAEIGGASYMLSAYSVDEDENLDTVTDRTLWVDIVNLKTGKHYYPIKMTDDKVSVSASKVTKLGNDVYLTFISDGYYFNIKNLTEMMVEMFAPEEIEGLGDVADTRAIKQAFLTSDENDEGWYQKTADELSMDKEMYEGSFYQRMADGNLKFDKENFRQTDAINTNISSYVVAGSSKDVYIYFVDFADKIINTNNAKEVYGVHYIAESYEAEPAEGKNGFTKAVQITGFGKVIDEISVLMNEDNSFTMVSDYYSQYIGSDGNIAFGPNSLVEIDYATIDSVEIDGAVLLPSNMTAGDYENISFSVINNGLLPAEGFRVKVTQLVDGKETEIMSDTVNTVLEAMEKTEVIAAWNVPEADKDAQILIYLDEGVSQEKATTLRQTIDIPAESKLNISDVEIDDIESIVTATVENIGRKSSKETEIILSGMNEKSNREYGRCYVPALNSGESMEISIPCILRPDDFTSLGTVELELAEEGGDVKSAFDFVASMPVVAQINGGQDSIEVKEGESAQLRFEVAPWETLAGEAEFYSLDGSVASVDSTGRITGINRGETTVYVYYPNAGVYDDINVNVVKSVSPGGGGGSAAVTSGVVIIQGANGTITAGKIGSDGKQKFTIKADPGYEISDVLVDGKSVGAVSEYTIANAGSKHTITAEFNKADNADTWNNPYSDVKKTDWFYDAVRFNSERGIMKGLEADKFGPFEKVNRAMFVTMLYRLEGEPETGTADFDDVAVDAYYAKAVAWASENKIVNGITGRKFGPAEDITRQQAAAILYRYAQYKKFNIIQTGKGIGAFDDRADISEYAEEAMAWCVNAGLINGVTDKRIEPKGNATRAQVAAMMQRLCENIIDKNKVQTEAEITE